MKYRIGQKVIMKSTDSYTNTNIAIIQDVEPNKVYPYLIKYISDDEAKTTALHVAEKGILCSYENFILRDTGLLRINPTTSHFEITKNGITCTMANLEKGSDKMSAEKILEIYQSKYKEEINEKLNDAINELEKLDPIRKIVDKHKAAIEKEIKALKLEEQIKEVEVNARIEYTEETLTKIKIEKEATEDRIKKLNCNIRDIKAVLNLVTEPDKAFDILIKQGIIDENYNIL